MNLYEDKEKLTSFIKVGITVLTAIAVFALGMNYFPNSVSVAINMNNKLPIYCVDTKNKVVALSFDTVTDQKETGEILDCLSKYGIKATFFITGMWLDEYPQDVKSIVAAGNELGNRSQNHKQMTSLTKEECLVEIQTLHDKVRELTGYEMQLFRAPYGEYNTKLMESCMELGYQSIQWSVDSMDWKDYDAATIVNRVLGNKNLENGSIILMHDIGKNTVDALPYIIQGLQEKGYQIVPVSQLIYHENYRIDRNGKQFQN